MAKIILFIKNNLVPLSIIFFGFLILILILCKPNLDTVQKIFSIISSLSIVIALVAYFNKKKQDELFATTEQISFFRKEVILVNEIFVKAMNEKFGDYKFPMFKLDHRSLKEITTLYFDNSKKQIDMLVKIDKDKDLLSEQIKLLNALEEFSLRVIYSKTLRHESLDSLRDTFVQFVEQNAMRIITMHEITSSRKYYKGILQLYKQWEPEYDRISPEERLASFLKDSK